ncbi:MAG: hypothetical protein MSG64_17595 [Pyrinomonadaceae bacterium MAG19_C2-C3]|nr:hypothetical protein [Pyrinomonadaceae bacterium MAG19_C2-C3]
MTPLEIRIELMRRGLNVSLLARKFGCRRQELSMTISQRRRYPHLREALATELSIPRKRLFNDAPASVRKAA